jgi:hypothetical protein
MRFRFMMPPARCRRAKRAGWTCLAAVAVLVACSAEGRLRKALVGRYVRQLDGIPGDYAREVLTLRSDGSWHRSQRLVAAGKERHNGSDSGSYYLNGVTLTLRSALVPGGVPTRFTVGTDTLFGANAAAVHAMTGYDIGEFIFVRQR